ncbi:MAG: hypothetical protein GY835_27570 [bacterium]|nr:hypothetical protein [bacterium]
MTPEISSALIGALAAILAVYVADIIKARLEYKREIRLAVAKLTRMLGAAAHSAAWLTWKVRYRPSRITASDIEKYDKEMHTLFPELTGALVVLAALNKSVYDKMRPLVLDVYKLDNDISETATKILEKDADGIKELDCQYDQANEMESELPEKAADIMRKV